MKPPKAIPISWIQRLGCRLDCGPYMSGAIEARMKMESPRLRSEQLKDVTNAIFHAGRESRTWVLDPKHGVPFLSSSAIVRADLSDLPFLSKKQVDAHPNFRIQSGWTLISRSGTIGRTIIVRPDMSGMACSEHAMRVVPDQTKIRPGYLHAFLRSRFGVPMVLGGTYGSIIQSIEPDHIARLLVPRLEDSIELEVHGLIDKGVGLLVQYQRGIERTTSHFFTAVGLQDISKLEWHRSGPDLGFSVKSPCIDSLRALNFNPRFKKLCQAIRKGHWLPLGDVCLSGTLQRAGRYKRMDASPEFALRLVGQKHLFWLEPEGRWVAKSALGPDMLVEPGTILAAALGTLGESELYCRTEFIWGNGVDNAYSENILRIVADESKMLRGSLFAFMRSETAFRMLRSISVGTKLQYHHHTFRAQLPIPIPDRRDQTQIHAAVVEAFEQRQEAVGLFHDAIRLVEHAIEEKA